MGPNWRHFFVMTVFMWDVPGFAVIVVLNWK